MDSYACNCEIYFKERIEQKVIFYEQGVEYETPDFLYVPFKSLQDCKNMKRLLKRL